MAEQYELISNCQSCWAVVADAELVVCPSDLAIAQRKPSREKQLRRGNGR